jgi:hypothetical protein
MDVMKIAYYYDYKTRIYQGESQIHKVAGYDEYILPQFSTWVAKPDFNEETEQAKFDVENQKWLVELKPVEVTAYHKQTHEFKVFNDSSLVTEEYTLEKPLTQWDEWVEGSWATNESVKESYKIRQNIDAAKVLRDQKITEGIFVHSAPWQVRTAEDLVNIQDIIDEAKFQNLPADATINFRLADNTWRPTTAQELEEVKSAYPIRKQEIFRQFEAWDMTDKLTPFEVVL